MCSISFFQRRHRGQGYTFHRFSLFLIRLIFLVGFLSFLICLTSDGLFETARAYIDFQNKRRNANLAASCSGDSALAVNCTALLCDYTVVKDNILAGSHGLIQFGQFLDAWHRSSPFVSSICIARLGTQTLGGLG